jgi:class 3 adenylate cyclase
MPASSFSDDSSADDGGARRLAAIAFVDIVDYSILMAEDEARTHRRWMALLGHGIRPGASRHRGRVSGGMRARAALALRSLTCAGGEQFPPEVLRQKVE